MYETSDCIMRKTAACCSALMIKECKNCPFYKSKREYYVSSEGYILPKPFKHKTYNKSNKSKGGLRHAN